ncbi:hypothetical protein [Micromonospora tulbaghiae]|uniref:Orc1-like AAA ATPase domain-containing protein n=1 Tax=Micromonospora tulbaghiae TaxID=479978 RepID=A0ABY0KP14_9ACTN|nr:hypothetical protein [Micromonospora tulbaghiae]MDX5460149.1 hypothetical protein [Micromonospora tulbaghiae]SCE90580.1 hypothetical protein GA0070562_4015 [Micromonospora tulbaghiae]
MAGELFFRTEDIRVDEVLGYLVETPTDRQIIDSLKGRSPVILRGSRGVGKSFLLRTAEAELGRDFAEERILPVYVTFARASLITNPTAERFLAWMIAKICNRIIRAATSAGLGLPGGSAIAAMRGGSEVDPSAMELVEQLFEDAWRTNSEKDPAAEIPGPELLRDAVEDLCRHTGLKRVALFVDEAAHVFIPQQQRQFFTLMRDLRSPYLSVKAAVYPGATAFGESFQPTHDATLHSLDRNVTGEGYARAMRELVLRQDGSLAKAIGQYGEVFDALAYASTGNPRILLKTVARSSPFNRRNAQETIRQYYREEIWGEHSSLAERYPGHRELIDWGRSFIESQVLPDLYSRNQRRGGAGEASSYLWIHRDAPQAVREALRLLCYSGILQEGVSGVRATRSEVGTRYMVNLGCQIALDPESVAYGMTLRRALSVKRMIEYGANHASYRPIDKMSLEKFEDGNNQALQARLQASIEILDLTDFQRGKLRGLGLETIGKVLASDESTFRQAHYVGLVRARQMRNAAVAAVLEYLSG